MNYNLFCQFQLGKLLFYSNTQPFWIDVYLKICSLEMLWNLNRKESIIRIIKLPEAEFKLTLITLPNLSFFRKHSDLFLGLVLFWISLFFFFLLFLSHLYIHFSPCLSSIWCFELSFFLLCHILLKFPPLLLIIVLLPFLQLPLLYCYEKFLLKHWQYLLGFNPLRWSNNFSIVAFQSWNMSYKVIFTTFPILTWISCHINFFEVGQFGQTLYTLVQFCDINEVNSHIQLFETLTSLDIFYFAYIIESNIEILKFLQLIQIFHLLDDIVLKVEYFQVPTQYVQILDLYQLLLVQ